MKMVCRALSLLLVLALLFTGCSSEENSIGTVFANPTDYQGVIFENGGMQLQLSVADTEELKDAQLHPEKYPDLMVRITGYSAVFVDMCTSAQNEIIRRDEVS